MTPANDNRPQWFDDLLLQYSPFLRKRCNVLLQDDPDAYQEVTCRALESWHMYRPDGHFPTWLNYIVRRVQFDGRRREFKRPYMASTVQDATQDTVLFIDDALNSDETGALKLSALGHTQREIAKMFRCDRKVIGIMLREARAAVANDNTPAQVAA